MEAIASDSTSWVHIGGWTNWGHGVVKGARLTLTESGGAYLIAFLALFVRLAGQHSWGIFCYLIFKYNQRNAAATKDTFGAASQSIFRNTNIDNAAAWQFFNLSWRSRTVGQGRVGRCISWTLFATLHAVAFLAAGIFVSKVAESGSSEVLLRGPTCGIWQEPGAFHLYNSHSQADTTENNLWSGWLTHNTLRSSEFTKQCYNVTSSTSALANCNAYAPSLVDWNVTTEADGVDCPYDDKMCAEGQVVRFDSGLLDSLKHFGINAKAEDRIKYRRVVECTPLTREGYVSDLLNVSQVHWSDDVSEFGIPQPNGQYQEYSYGPNVEYNMTSTYIWNNYSLGDSTWVNTAQSIYGLDIAIWMLDYPDGSVFTPIPEMNRSDADTIMYFLLSEVLYLNKVNDPWFRATTFVEDSDNLFISSPAIPFDIYGPDYNAGAVACTQQFQYCNHDGSLCSPLTGEGYGGGLRNSISAFADGLDLNAKQLQTLSRLVQASWNGDMDYVTWSGGGANLLAADAAATTWALPSLPDNQWILEFQHYFLMGLTSMQMQIASYATGPPGESNYQYITKPGADEEWMCKSQIVQRSGYSTFSVLGIAAVLVVGGLLVVVDLCLPGVVTGLRTGRGHDAERESWDGYHHLERLLREHQHMGNKKKEPNQDLSYSSSLNGSEPKQATIGRKENDKQTETSYVNDFSRSIDDLRHAKVKRSLFSRFTEQLGPRQNLVH